MKKTVFRSGLCFLLIFVMMFTALAPTVSAANSWNNLEIPQSLIFSNQLLWSKDYGCSENLRGDVLVVCYFVEDDNTGWTDAEMDKALTTIEQELKNIENQADQYNVTLDLQVIYGKTTASDIVSDPLDSKYGTGTWVNRIINRYGAIDAFKQFYEFDEIAFMFYMNNIGRDRVYYTDSSKTTLGEYAVMHSSDSRAFQHELFHLFGAKDLYYPDKVTSYALKYLGNSVMNDSSIPTTDVYTAYMIGWTETVNQETLNFLNATKGIPESEFKQDESRVIKTGYTQETYDNGTYIGEFYNGVRHGQGTYTWTDGDSYTGQWDNGERTGYGIYTYANGNRYEGNFFKGEFSGFGTFYWANGTVYEGNWKDSNTKSGYGTMTWTNGEKYVGSFENDMRNGYGTYTYKNGGKYEGNWKDGEKHGYGVYTRKGYKTQKGNWVNGKYKGK